MGELYTCKDVAERYGVQMVLCPDFAMLGHME